MVVCTAETPELWMSSRSGYNESKIPLFGTSFKPSMSTVFQFVFRIRDQWSQFMRLYGHIGFPHSISLIYSFCAYLLVNNRFCLSTRKILRSTLFLPCQKSERYSTYEIRKIDCLQPSRRYTQDGKWNVDVPFWKVAYQTSPGPVHFSSIVVPQYWDKLNLIPKNMKDIEYNYAEIDGKAQVIAFLIKLSQWVRICQEVIYTGWILNRMNETHFNTIHLECLWCISALLVNHAASWSMFNMFRIQRSNILLTFRSMSSKTLER